MRVQIPPRATGTRRLTADIRILEDSISRVFEKATVAACSPAINEGAGYLSLRFTTTLAGGVGCGYFVCRTGNAGSNPAPGPVSYTHLDVYKRQLPLRRPS